MIVKTYQPSDRLKPFIKTFLIIESQDERINRVLPDTSLVMAFRFRGRVSHLKDETQKILSSSVISGLRMSGRLINYSKGTGNILVIFKETGARAFIKEPLHELFEASISLDCLSNFQNLSAIEEQIAAADNNFQRIELIEKYLLSKLYNYKTDPLILFALENIRHSNGIINIKNLADSVCLSIDAFEKRFRRAVGVSPKKYSKIIRLKCIINNGLRPHSLVETAFNAGYFDQPHFNKDFKLFTGQTPTDFLKSPTFW